MRDTHSIRYIYIRDIYVYIYVYIYTILNGFVDSSWDPGLFVSLRSPASLRNFLAALFFFYFSGTAPHAEKVPARTQFAYKVPLRHRRPIVSRLIHDVIYTAGEKSRCNESRRYGRIKASRKLIRRVPRGYRMYFADELPLEAQSKELRAQPQPRAYDLKYNGECKARCTNDTNQFQNKI